MSISEFQQVRSSLISMITEDSPNAIQEIIYDLTWDDTVYRTFNEGLAIANKQGLQERLPGTLIEYMHKTHFIYVLAQLRKLYESKQKEYRSVNSIPTILSIIKDNRHLWTRENFITYDALSYSPLSSESSRDQHVRQQRHKLFNLFTVRESGSPPDHSDTLDAEIISKLLEEAQLSKDLGQYTNKYALHAAAANNRPTPDSFDSVSLQAAEEQMRHGVMLTHQIGKLLDHLILTEVPHPQFDQLAAWEHSFFTPAIKDQLFDYWTERMELWATWSETYWSWDHFYLTEDDFISMELEQ